MELCLACDIIVAAETARFGLPEVKHNLVAIGGGLIRLQHRVPYNIAMEMALTGAIKEAAFLHQWGFVNKLCAHDTALATAMAFARSLLANGPTALAASKEIMFRSRSWADEAEAWDKQSVIAERAIKSDDFKEGLAAFAEKRKPIWKGS
jgi:enoyl-CoA hydratase